MDARRGDEAHIAEDPAEPTHVLRFEVAAVVELVDADGDHVVAGCDQIGDVEFGRLAASLAEPDRLAVDPDVEGGIDALEAQLLNRVPKFGQGDALTARIVADVQDVVAEHFAAQEAAGS